MGRTFALAPPPRSLSFTTQLAAIFGATTFQVAMGIASFGMIFFWVFAWNSELVTQFEFDRSLKETRGEVTAVRSTSSSENKRRIMANHFRYSVGGNKYQDVSYSVSSGLKVGEKVDVEYIVERPSRARIKGLRARTFGAGGGMATFAPIAGVVLAIIGIIRGLRTRRLLRIGHLGHARQISKVATNTRVNKRTVYRYTFELIVPPETPATYRDAWQSWAQTHRFEHKTSMGHAISDEAEEPVLYDPQRPGNAVLIDAMHGGIELGEGGHIGARSWMLYLVLPAAVLVVNAIAYAVQSM